MVLAVKLLVLVLVAVLVVGFFAGMAQRTRNAWREGRDGPR